MAQFIPSKKTIKDFNDGERYLNKIDVVQSQTVNNLVEGLLFAQENAGSGGGTGSANSVLYIPQTLTDSQKRQARENISAGTSNFSGNYNDLIGTPDLSVYAKSADLSNYVTLNTKQYITGEKTFDDQIIVSDSDTLSARYGFNGISRTDTSGRTTHTYTFPDKSGTFLLDNDMPDFDNYVTLNTYQIIEAQKWFSNGITASRGITADDDSDMSATLNPDNITFFLDEEHVLSFPRKSGTLLIDSDLKGLVSEDRLANVAFTGKYQDLVGAPTSGVHSVNGQTGDVIIDRDTLGLADVALTGYYGDLSDTPDLSVYAKSADLSNYVTLNTKQYITGEKTFDDQIIVSDSDTLSARYGFNGISRTDTSGRTTHTYTFPDKSGTFLLDNDMPDFDNYVTLNTYQIIEAQKWFSNGITASRGITADDDSDMSATLNPDNITFFLDEEHVLSFPRKSGTLLIDSDLKGLVSEDRLANVAFTGKYQDLVGAPTSGVHSVNGQTGDVIIDRDTLGLADVALTGYYGDLSDTPDLSVYAKSADLSNYVTRNTEQDIYGKKWFYGGIAFDNSSVRNGYVQIGDGKIIVGDSYGENEILFPQKSGTLALLSDIGSGNSGIDYETGEKYLGNNEYISLKAPPVGSKWLYIISCNIEGSDPPFFGLINIDGRNVFPIESRFFADEQGAMNAEIKILVTRNAEGSNSFVIMCTGGTYYTTTEDFSEQDGTFGFGLDQDDFGWLEMQLSYICIK